MMDVGRHPNIELLTHAEVEDVSGYVGNFTARIRKRARYVYEKDCTACGDCAVVCPVAVPDEFQMGLGTRKAIHIAFPQAVPSAYVINADECLGQNPIACGKCIEACEKQCIDFDMHDQVLDVKVAVARSHWLHSQDEEQITVTDAALVIGGGVAGIQAALDLADSGHKVFLVEKKPSIGGIMAQLDKVYPDIECSI
jgi:heterodisulfide reductase subunit A-like polyferredoxin